MPAAYEDNVFLDCEGDVQDPVGIYSVNGVSESNLVFALAYSFVSSELKLDLAFSRHSLHLVPTL